jgi:hypothetical protein
LKIETLGQPPIGKSIGHGLIKDVNVSMIEKNNIENKPYNK